MHTRVQNACTENDDGAELCDGVCGVCRVMWPPSLSPLPLSPATRASRRLIRHEPAISSAQAPPLPILVEPMPRAATEAVLAAPGCISQSVATDLYRHLHFLLGNALL